MGPVVPAVDAAMVDGLVGRQRTTDGVGRHQAMLGGVSRTVGGVPLVLADRDVSFAAGDPALRRSRGARWSGDLTHPSPRLRSTEVGQPPRVRAARLRCVGPLTALLLAATSRRRPR